MMKNLALCLLVLVSGCSSTHRKGTSYVDTYDGVKVDQMTGNYISGEYLGKTLVCLNARRETRRVTAITNQFVLLVTNPVVLTFTNTLKTSSTNFAGGVATNQLPPPPPLVMVTNADTGAVEPAPVTAAIPASPEATTNVSLMKTADSVRTVNLGNNQEATTLNVQTGTTVNNQVTTNANNLAVTYTTNQTVRTELNETVTTVTNFSISAVTNVIVIETNELVQDHFLFTELTPPPDFILANGESLVLMLDGVRYGFAPTNSSTAFVERRGFVSTLYKVPPEALVALANAKSAKIRIRGVNRVIERDIPKGAKENFKQYLVKYYTPESTTADPSLRPEKPPAWPKEQPPIDTIPRELNPSKGTP